MSDPICLKCNQPCDVRQVDNTPWNQQGGQSCDVGCTGVSVCCGAGYVLPVSALDLKPDAFGEPGNLRDFIEENGGYWDGEHDLYPVCDWVTECQNGDTRESYWEWVYGNVERDEENT